MVLATVRLILEGNIAVGDYRQVGFAEFGVPQGRGLLVARHSGCLSADFQPRHGVYAEGHNIRLDRKSVV